MKKYFTLVLLLFFYSAQAQLTEKEQKRHVAKVAKSKEDESVVRSWDTIFSSGIPYAILTEKKTILGESDYTLFSLSGKELISIPYECNDDGNEATEDECYTVFLFLQSGKRGELQIEMWVKIEEVIVENDLVKDTAINPFGENKFLMRYPPKFSTRPRNTTVVIVNNSGSTVTSSGNNYETVERNRNSTITLFGDELKQDFKLIGTAKKSSSSKGGKLIYTITFSLPNGTKIAEATGDGFNATEWKVVTLKDNQSRSVTTTTNQQEKQIAKYLSDLFYL